LSNIEIKAIWHTPGQFGDLCRLLLLTGQRREKVLGMRWTDLAGDVWSIRTEAREKGNAGTLRLPPVAMAIIEAHPPLATNPPGFAGRSDGAACLAQSKYKSAFDAASGVSGWVLHDLRRTARSLMSRAGVQSEHAERVLGHVIPGIEGIYNRHQYTDEKAAAL